MNVGSHLSKRAELNPGLEALVDEAAGRRFAASGADTSLLRVCLSWTSLPLDTEHRFHARFGCLLLEGISPARLTATSDGFKGERPVRSLLPSTGLRCAR
jgi:hypothetical protein